MAIEGQGQNLSYAIGNFEPTFTEFESLFRVLNSQKLAVSKLFSNGAKTFEALRGREGELANLIRSSNELFKTTADRNEDIEALFRAFPTFHDESRLTVDRLQGFATNADPLSKQLVPVAEELSPTLIKFGELAPEAKKLFEALPAVEREAPTGFPAFRKLFRDDFPPLLRAVDPFVRNLNPLVTGLGLYKREVTAFFGNLAVATNAELTETTPPARRSTSCARWRRSTPNRSPAIRRASRSTGTAPTANRGWADEILHGLPSFNTANCSSGPGRGTRTEHGDQPGVPRTRPAASKKTAKNSPQHERAVKAEELLARIKKYAFGEQSSTAAAPTPPCRQQQKIESIYGNGEKTQYQHTFEQTGR